MTARFVKRPDYLSQGESARLIPVGSETSGERSATSVLLAVFMAVEEYGKRMLQSVGAPAKKSAKISCLTEVVFKQAPDIKKFRPDGLIIVSMGSRKFTALVEAKIGNTKLKPEQIEAYLDIARQNSIDAVVTISNQFAPLPSHHPVSVSKHKTRTVQLFHWSWQSLFSEAVLLADHDGIDDDEREFLLKELIRFLEHESSGVLAFRQMGRNWKEVCGAAHQGNLLTKTSPEVIDAAASWQQLTRYLSLKLSRAVGRRVAIHMPRKHTSHPEMRLTDIVNRLVGDQRLADEFEIPDAASRLTLLADLNRRTLTAGMTLEAPRDVKRPRASVN